MSDSNKNLLCQTAPILVLFFPALLRIQVGDLLSSLKQRMSDSNKNLVCQALQLAAKVARAMGRPIDRMGRPMLAPALRNISDQKAQVRYVDLLMAVHTSGKGRIEGQG